VTIQIPAAIWTAANQAAPDLALFLSAIALNESPTGSPGDWTFSADGSGPYWPAGTPGTHPTSFGYLQLHTPGGLGDGYSIAQLNDPVTNFAIGAAYVRAHGGATYAALGAWTTAQADWATYQQLLAQGTPSQPGSPGKAPLPTTGLSSTGLAFLGLVAVIGIIAAAS